MRSRISFLILLILTRTPSLFSEVLNPKDTVGLGKVVANVPAIAWAWNFLLNEAKARPDVPSRIMQDYDTIFTFDINRDGFMDVVASLAYADMGGSGGGTRTATIVALRDKDSLVLYFSADGHAKGILDSVIQGHLVLWNEVDYGHGFFSSNTMFYEIWPRIDTLLRTYTYSNSCLENETFRFVKFGSLKDRLIARFFERKCDTTSLSPYESGPEKKLELFRFDSVKNRYEAWKPKDNKIWKMARSAFGPLLEGVSLDELKGEQK